MRDWSGAGDAMPPFSPSPPRDLNLPLGYCPFTAPTGGWGQAPPTSAPNGGGTVTNPQPEVPTCPRGSDWSGAGDAMPARQPRPPLDLPLGYCPFTAPTGGWGQAPPTSAPNNASPSRPPSGPSPLYDHYNGAGFDGIMFDAIWDAGWAAWNAWVEWEAGIIESYPILVIFPEWQEERLR